MRGGILIIGSLLWDGSTERQTWRSRRLLLERHFVVVPLNYGRRSQSRGNTFTMTFDTAAASGRAVVVPCATSPCRAEDLVNEAEALWKAEQPSANAGALSATWGCVGLLFRAVAPDGWLKHWGNIFRQRASAISPVDDRGILQIDWPSASDGGDIVLDFLLATATRREDTRPTPEMIADAWVDQQDGHERYFFENVRNGIRTSDDFAIWKRIAQRKPTWLGKADHAAAMGILTAEQERGA